MELKTKKITDTDKIQTTSYIQEAVKCYIFLTFTLFIRNFDIFVTYTTDFYLHIFLYDQVRLATLVSNFSNSLYLIISCKYLRGDVVLVLPLVKKIGRVYHGKPKARQRKILLQSCPKSFYNFILKTLFLLPDIVWVSVLEYCSLAWCFLSAIINLSPNFPLHFLYSFSCFNKSQINHFFLKLSTILLMCLGSLIESIIGLPSSVTLIKFEHHAFFLRLGVTKKSFAIVIITFFFSFPFSSLY